jgi:hypothetical protein
MKTSSTSSVADGPPGASVAIEADDYHHGHSPDEEEDGNGVLVNLGHPSQSDSPCSVVSSQSIVLTSGNQHSGTSVSPMSSNNQSLPASPLDTKTSEVITLPPKLDTDQPPSPPISLGLEMPLDTQSMGIPIEMTAGQIMEAEMSAGSLLDDEVVSASTSMNMSEFLTHNRHSPHNVRSSRCSLGSDHEALSHAEQQTLPENVFNHDFLSAGTPSPKTMEQQPSMTKSTSMMLLDDLESDMEQSRDKMGADFSLDGIVCSIQDTNNMDEEDLVAKDFETKISDIEKCATEKRNEDTKSIFNNNQTQIQLTTTKISTRQRKRNL